MTDPLDRGFVLVVIDARVAPRRAAGDYAETPGLVPGEPSTGPVGRVAVEIRTGPIAIDPEARRVTLAGRPLVLTRGEYELLSRLAAAPGRVFTKQELLRAPSGSAPDAPHDTRRLDAQVARLRRRLGAHRALVVTVWGIGYRLGGQA